MFGCRILLKMTCGGFVGYSLVKIILPVNIPPSYKVSGGPITINSQLRKLSVGLIE
jgi:hypothetical protein